MKSIILVRKKHRCAIGVTTGRNVPRKQLQILQRDCPVHIIRSPKTSKEWESYYSLRWSILRKPIGMQKGTEKDDIEDSAIHRAIFKNKKIIGVGRLHYIDKNTSQIRYMAIIDQYRGVGLGKLMVEEFINISKKNNVLKVILYARESAIHFYKKMDFEISQKAHRLGDINHYLMHREIVS